MKKALAIYTLLAASLAAQNLTSGQKEADFRALVDTINHWYAPVDWKKQLFQFDALEIKPWLERVARTGTDLEFYEVCVDYIASLQDTHSAYVLPTNFVAQLGFSVDIYDGKVLVELINRNLLPDADFPFAVGDEVVSVDGVQAEELVRQFSKYAPQGNTSATRRLAAARITSRPQSRMPHASQLGESAVVVIRRQSGDEETYTIPWTKTGTPLEVGAVPDLRMTAKAKHARVWDWHKDLQELQWSGVSAEDGVLNYGSRNPIFLGGLMAMGSNFTRRLGGGAADFFYSGIIRHEGMTFGFLRIPSYAPPSIPAALQQLDREIAFFEENTDGLIIDQMRNTGGNLCFGENVTQRLALDRFWTTGFELRAMYWRTLSYYNAMINAKASGAPPEVIDQYEKLYAAMRAANEQNRGVTEPIPICTSSPQRDPYRNVDGVPNTYTKPVMMMIDEFSTSTGDSVPSMFQEARRGLLYGMRSNGAGGNNTSVPVGAYSEGSVGVTMGLQVKRTSVSIEGYPTTGRLENVGVHPDVVNDYMTRQNLLQNGAPFVRQFVDEMVKYVESKQ